jgi:hypothetical protein
MKRARVFLRVGAAVLSVFVLAPAFCAAQELEPFAAAAEFADDSALALPPELEELARASSPSAAIAAYARAQAALGDDLLVERVLIERMVELGAPDLCEDQARHLVKYVSDDGLAWAVLAFNAARANDYMTALGHIVRAVRHEPEDPFVQRTAGQLLAWYDTQGRRVRVSSDLREGIQRVRRALAGQDEFDEAYREARGFFDEAARPVEVAEVEPPPLPSITTITRVARGPSYVRYHDVYPAPRRVYVDYGHYIGARRSCSIRTGVAVVRRDRDRRDGPIPSGWGATCVTPGRRVVERDRRDGHHLRPPRPHGSDDRLGLPRPSSGPRTGLVPRDSRSPSRSGGALAPPGPFRFDLPGHKPPSTPGLKPPSTPGYKPPAAPGLRPPSPPGRRPPSTPGLRPPSAPGWKPTGAPGLKASDLPKSRPEPRFSPGPPPQRSARPFAPPAPPRLPGHKPPAGPRGK